MRPMASRRRSTKRKSPSRTAKGRSSTRKALPKPIDPNGQHLHVLSVPYEARQAASFFGAKWDAARKAHVYVGDPLPPELARFKPAPLSWEARIEEDVNGGRARDIAPTEHITLRPHQAEAVTAIVAAHHAGLPGFLLADDVGLGKTFAACAAVHELPASRRNVLVVCPKSVIPAWRRSIMALGTGGRRWTVINHDGLKKLIDPPKSAATVKKTTTKNNHIADNGTPIVDWDVVIHDESHAYRNPTSMRSRIARNLSGFGTGTTGLKAGKAFTIWASATAGQNPLELVYLAPLLTAVTGQDVADLEEFQVWCTDIGLSITKGDYGRWMWDRNPDDVELIRTLLFDRYTSLRPPAGIRRVPTDIAGWPEQQHIPHPLELDADERRLYDEAWTEFRRAMDLVQRGKDPNGGLAAQTRFRQKASLLRADGTVEQALTLLDSGRQVFISCQWLESLEEIAESLRGKRVKVAVIHGQMGEGEREQNRTAFQTGAATVIVSTVTTGINLQQGESGGNDVPRATILHDVRWSAIETHQTMGRCHRDGQNAIAYLTYAVDTVEEKIIGRMVQRLGDMAAWQGDDDASIAEMEALLVKAAAGGMAKVS